MAKKTVPVDALEVGMFVTALDISWINSPFMTHQRLLQSAADIASLKAAGAREVTIDTDRSVSPGLHTSAGSDCTPTQPDAPTNAPESVTTEDAAGKASLKAELAVARRIREVAINTINQTFDALNKGEVVDSQQLSGLVDDTLDSLGRNDQALMTLLHLQRHSAQLSQHVFSCFAMALALASHLGMDMEQKRTLGTAALLHDIGWMRLPLNLFTKGKPYTPTEKQLAAQHAQLSGQIVQKLGTVSPRVVHLVAHHHDGTIPDTAPGKMPAAGSGDLQASILAVVDQYDLLLHGLMDQHSHPAKGALGHLFQMAGKGLLDNSTVAHLIQFLGIYPVSSAVQLNTREKAVVIESHRDAPTQPTIAIYYDVGGQASLSPTVVDLRRQTGEWRREIASVLDLKNPASDPARLLNVEQDF